MRRLAAGLIVSVFIVGAVLLLRPGRHATAPAERAMSSPAQAPAPGPEAAGTPPAGRPPTGFVHQRDGSPAAGVRVSLVPRPVALPPECPQLLGGCPCETASALFEVLSRELAPLEETTTDDGGAFVLPAARPGLGLLSETELETGAQVVPATGPARIVSWPRTLTVRAEDGGAVTGSVVVGLMEERRVGWVRRIGADGRLVVPAAARVLVLTPGYLPVFDTVNLKSTITMRRGTFVSGTVRGAGGGVRVEARTGDGAVCASATTSADGSYRLGPLPLRHFRIVAEEGGRRAIVALRANEGELDAGLDLEAPGSVTIRALDRKTGKPVAGVEVTIRSMTREGRWSLSERDSAEGVTDADGRLSVSLAPGTITVRARHEDYADLGFPSLPDSTLPSGGAIELVLPLQRHEGLSGRVVDSQGRPVVGASVGCAYARASRAGTASGSTDAQGRFQVDCPPGDVTVGVSSDGFLSQKHRLVSPADGLSFHLTRGATARGVVLDEAGEPVEEVEVEVGGEHGGWVRTTDRDGKFQVEGTLADGAWEVIATERAEGRARPLTRTRVARSARMSFEVRAGVAPFLELRLTASRRVSGRVVDAKGAPVANVGVLLEQGAAEPAAANDDLEVDAVLEMVDGFARAQFLRGVETRSDADGRFRLEHLGALSYTVRVVGEGVQEDPRAPALVRPDTTDVEVHTVRVPRVKGRVCDASGAGLRAFKASGSDVHSPDGSFELHLGRAGVHTVSFRAEGFESVTRVAKVSWNGVADLGEVRLSPGRSLTVRAVDATTGIGVEPKVYHQGIFLERDAETSLVRGLPAGPATLTVEEADHVPVSVLVPAGQKELVVRLERGATVRGVWQGPLTPGLQARLLSPSNDAPVAVDEQGRFTFEHVAAGRFVVQVRDTRVRGEATVTVPPAGFVNVTVEGQ